ncbi:MAG: helix-turn-helix domain-containing protein [Clostridiales bacterium]|jgi:transcriptional regulator with XRE-family HTH domain|nr:helix-turn-helix domain-containing protein [Clostridiales bacterium]
MTKEELRNIIGENIRTERNSRDLSLDELAELLQLTPGFVGLIERGKRGATAHTLYKLSEALEMPMEQFFQGGFSQSAAIKVSEENPLVVKRNKINTVIQSLNESELDFVLSVIKSLRLMHKSPDDCDCDD